MSTGYLLDTNILSELMRASPTHSVIAFLAKVPETDIYVADVTIAELRFGASLLENAVRRQGIFDAIEERIRPRFLGRNLSADEETWIIWKSREREGRRRGYTFSQPDLVIACLAIQHDLAIVTRDIEPFRQAGVTLINPWQD